MPTHVCWYECNICHTKHESEEEALQCEALGQPEFNFKAGEKFTKRFIWGEHELTIIEPTVKFWSGNGGKRAHIVSYRCTTNRGLNLDPKDGTRETWVSDRELLKKIKENYILTW